MKNIFIDILAYGTLISAILVISATNPVISVIFLVSVFLNAAGYLILSGIGFIGISYIIIYVGAITILFLFVIMMINIKLTDLLETGKEYTKNFPFVISIGSLFLYEISRIVPLTFNNLVPFSAYLKAITSSNLLLLDSNTSYISNIFKTVNPTIADTNFTNFLQIEAIGQGLYTYGAFLLIISSMILLLAMVAPIFLSRKPKI